MPVIYIQTADTQWDSMFTEGDDDDSITNYLTK